MKTLKLHYLFSKYWTWPFPHFGTLLKTTQNNFISAYSNARKWPPRAGVSGHVQACLLVLITAEGKAVLTQMHRKHAVTSWTRWHFFLALLCPKHQQPVVTDIRKIRDASIHVNFVTNWWIFSIGVESGDIKALQLLPLHCFRAKAWGGRITQSCPQSKCNDALTRFTIILTPEITIGV